MKTKPKDDWLIGKLLEETYQCVPSEETSKSPDDLFDYFINHKSHPKSSSRELVLRNYFQCHGLVLVPLQYRSQSKCYRMVLNNLVFDFPSNWGIFKNINSLSSTDFLMIAQEEDQTSLATILSELVLYPADIVIIADAGEKLFALTRESSEEDREWLEHFFGIQEIEQKKAA